METFTDDTVVALASFLSPKDMLSLALTCKRFGHKYGTTTSRSRRLAAREANKSKSGGSGREVRQKTEPISLMEVAARTVLYAKWTDEEKKALSRRENESWIGLYQEFLKLFHYPLQFDKLVGDCVEYEANKKSVVCRNLCGAWDAFHSAICTNIMRAGRHTVSFNVNNPYHSGTTLGIMRPTTEEITMLNTCYPVFDDLSTFSLKRYGSLYRNSVDSCLLSTINGQAFICKRWEVDPHTDMNGWEGMEEIRETSFKLGFVLDLDEGTLDVYKNDRLLGNMVAGLTGEYCWVVSLRPEYDVNASKIVSINR